WRGNSDPGGTGTGSSTSSSWCPTFPGSSTFPGVQRCREGVPGVAWEGRALARPRHRAGARRSQETRPGSSTLPGGSVSVKQSEGHAAPDRALGLLLFPLGCADVLGQGAAGILVLLL